MRTDQLFGGLPFESSKISAGVLAAAVAGTGLVSIAQAPIASAGCDEGGYHYSFSKVSTGWKRTSLRSSYLRGPGTITYGKGKSWSVNASATATVGAEAGVVFAKASASIGVTVGASSSGTQSFSYTKPVPKGKLRALQQYKQTKQFTVHKYWVDRSCKVRTVYKTTVKAPYKSNKDKYLKWDLVS